LLRKYQGLLTDYYGYVTNLLRLCYGIAGMSLKHAGFTPDNPGLKP